MSKLARRENWKLKTENVTEKMLNQNFKVVLARLLCCSSDCEIPKLSCACPSTGISPMPLHHLHYLLTNQLTWRDNFLSGHYHSLQPWIRFPQECNKNTNKNKTLPQPKIARMHLWMRLYSYVRCNYSEAWSRIIFLVIKYLFYLRDIFVLKLRTILMTCPIN